MHVHSRLFAREEKEAEAAIAKNCRCHGRILAPYITMSRIEYPHVAGIQFRRRNRGILPQ